MLAQGLVLLPAGALLLLAWSLDATWLRHHILPEFFQPRAEQLRDLALIRAALVVLAVFLLWPVGPWLARRTSGRPLRQLLLDVLPSLVAAVLALGVGELLLQRLPWFATHELPTQREPLRQRDPVLGWAYRPARTSHGALGGHDVQYAFDAAGHRVRSQAQPVDYAAPSILFLGESIISGHGVDYDQTIPAQVGAALELQPADLAVGGYATDQMYLRFAAEWSRYRQPRAVVILFMPSLFHRNLEQDRPHLAPDLTWRPPAGGSRLLQVARRLVPYRSDRELDDAYAMTHAALARVVAQARARGATPLIVVPDLGPESAEEQAIRRRALAGLPYLQVPVDPAWHISRNRHPDARADAAIATAVTAWLRAHGV